MIRALVNKPLLLGAIFSAVAALAHLGCILFGASWYRFFGAGEQMAIMAEAGHSYPTQVTSVLIFILSVWAIYGLSGANVITKLPLIRVALILISSIYILRGLAFVFIMPMFPQNSLTFWLVSSAICFSIGMLYALGTYQSWARLSAK
ncbi:hypothetical protein NQT69_03295 [Pseudoalteromonas shioyasakiensis]|uniref:hypothetical protein n=1 Tax=Pseudoalteromonas shioyasakiensis TaxID=1190813 RepID=UPI0021198F43|nr:hypothetical protein [Pseudoalteromonas shioyasakiensis]MCQ8877063.1 hypothetical protein [Pseudoalteromonas shioyasakiensis]